MQRDRSTRPINGTSYQNPDHHLIISSLTFWQKVLRSNFKILFAKQKVFSSASCHLSIQTSLNFREVWQTGPGWTPYYGRCWCAKLELLMFSLHGNSLNTELFAWKLLFNESKCPADQPGTTPEPLNFSGIDMYRQDFLVVLHKFLDFFFSFFLNFSEGFRLWRAGGFTFRCLAESFAFWFVSFASDFCWPLHCLQSSLTCEKAL